MANGYTFRSTAITPGIGRDIFRGAKAQTEQAQSFRNQQVQMARRQQTLAEVTAMAQDRQFQINNELKNRQLDAQIDQNKASLEIRGGELEARLNQLKLSGEYRVLQTRQLELNMQKQKEGTVLDAKLRQNNLKKDEYRRYDALRATKQYRVAGAGEVPGAGEVIEHFPGIDRTLIGPAKYATPVAAGQRQLASQRFSALKFNVSKWDRRISVFQSRLERNVKQYNRMAVALAELNPQWDAPGIKSLKSDMAAFKRTSIDPMQEQIDAAQDTRMEAEDALGRYMEGLGQGGAEADLVNFEDLEQPLIVGVDVFEPSPEEAVAEAPASGVGGLPAVMQGAARLALQPAAAAAPPAVQQPTVDVRTPEQRASIEDFKELYKAGDPVGVYEGWQGDPELAKEAIYEIQTESYYSAWRKDPKKMGILSEAVRIANERGDIEMRNELKILNQQLALKKTNPAIWEQAISYLRAYIQQGKGGNVRRS